MSLIYNIQHAMSKIISVIVLTIFVASTSSGQSFLTVKHEVSLDSAIHYIQNFKRNSTVPNIQSGFFNRNVLDKILGQSQCVGIRYYFAKLDNGQYTLVAVGVDSLGNDLENGIIAQQIVPCPPICGSSSRLNGGK